MLAMSLVATVLFVTEPIPLPTVPLLIIVGEIVLLGLNPSKVAQSLMTDSVLFIMGSLMLAVAIVKQKLDKRVAWAIVQMTGTNAYWISFGITAVCGFIAAFIGEHTVAAMMLPVGVRLVSLTHSDPRKVHNLAAVILFSISYGCSIASIATPSGGARNAIMIGYWQEIFFSPVDPATRRYLMDYLTWIIYAFPMFLLRLPIVTALLFWTFRPESSDMSRAVARLRTQVMMDGPLKLSDWLSIGIFLLTILGWIFLSDTLGLGSIALMGVCAFLVFGLVRWEEINQGVNWGVVLLYAAAISLGVEMQATGAAEWLAADGHRGAAAVRSGDRCRARARDLAAHHRRVEHHDRRRGGGGAWSGGPQNRPCRRAGSDRHRLHHRDLVGIRLSHPGGPAGIHHHLCVRLSQRLGFSEDRS